jgi:hypothetical protein
MFVSYILDHTLLLLLWSTLTFYSYWERYFQITVSLIVHTVNFKYSGWTDTFYCDTKVWYVWYAVDKDGHYNTNWTFLSLSYIAAITCSYLWLLPLFFSSLWNPSHDDIHYFLVDWCLSLGFGHPVPYFGNSKKLNFTKSCFSKSVLFTDFRHIQKIVKSNY